MPYLTIENFKYGLDTRRSELTSQAGVLAVCENAHVNQGGEVEKRKAFVRDAQTLVLDSNGDQGTWGLETTSVGKMLFGSAFPFGSGYTTANGLTITKSNRYNNPPTTSGGFGATVNITAVNGLITVVAINAGGTGWNTNDLAVVTQGSVVGGLVKVTNNVAGVITTLSVQDSLFQQQPILVSAMPAGYTYQQLKHPALTDDYDLSRYEGANRIVYDRAKHRITAVKSASYKGLSFVLATFSDGNTFIYYNGTVVRQSYSGILLSSFAGSTAQKNNYIAYQVGKQFEALSGWGNGTAVVDPVSEPDANLVTKGIGCPAATTFTMSLSLSSSVDKMSTVVGLASTNVAASGPAQAAFTVAGSAGKTYKLYAPIISTLSGAAVGTTSGRTNMSLTSPETITWGTDNATTATAIAAAVNLLTTITGYSASAVGAVVTVSAPIPPIPTIGSSDPIYFNSLTGGSPLPLVVTSTDGTANGVHNWTMVNYTNAFGQRGNVNVYGTDWTTGDTWTIAAANAGTIIKVGKGNISGQNWVSAVVVGQRVYLAFSSTFAYCAVDDPTAWESQNTGASTVNFQSQFGSVDTVQAFSIYQGRLAVFGVYSIQIWTTDANPASFVRNQILQNIGTDAPFSVQPFGELDVFFRSLSGVRSLRVRDSSLNGYVTDIGSPIDGILDGNTAVQRQVSLAIMEPTAHRYWLYENGVIYVLSYFPTLKISAWSTYLPASDFYPTTVLPNALTYPGSDPEVDFTTLVDGQTYSWTPGAHESGLLYNLVLLTGPQTFVFHTGDTVGSIGLSVLTTYTGSMTTTNVKLPDSQSYGGPGTNTFSVLITGGIYSWAPGPNEISLTIGGVTYTTATDFVARASFGTLVGSPSSPYTGVLTSRAQVLFTPEKFIVHQGQVFVRATSGDVFALGGATGTTYDYCVAMVETPWLDVKNKVSTKKQSMSVDEVAVGAWDMYASMDYRTGVSTLKRIKVADSVSSPDQDLIPFRATGTHVKLQAKTVSNTAAVLSALVWHYNDAGEKK